jgi:uncharacterized membrane protein YgcG
MLLALVFFEQVRQLADTYFNDLKCVCKYTNVTGAGCVRLNMAAMPAVFLSCCCGCRWQVADGSFDKFVSKFIAINTDGLGYVDLTQLAVYIASISSSGGSSADVKSGSRTSSRGSGNGSAAGGSRGGASGSAAAGGGGGKPRQSSAMSSASTRLSTASSRYTSSTPVSKAAG